MPSGTLWYAQSKVLIWFDALIVFSLLLYRNFAAATACEKCGAAKPSAEEAALVEERDQVGDWSSACRDSTSLRPSNCGFRNSSLFDSGLTFMAVDQSCNKT